MTVTAALIFIGIPLAGVVAGLAAVIGTLAGWNKTAAPESHYIASRHPLIPKDEAEAVWLEELESLQIPYRHTVC